jgi:FADH2 O2-dependent halogenase
MPGEFDLIIVGSGFAGAILAMIARRLGRSVLMIERGRHPRFTIGESSTPMANLMLETLADRYDLPRLRPLSKWGTWQTTYPGIGCGLKRGFSFFNHVAGEPWIGAVDRSDQLLVAASPNDQIADTHWHRPDFDHFLVQEAVSLGAEYVDETELTEFSTGAAGVTVRGRRASSSFEARAKFLIDASGPRGFLHRRLELSDAGFAGYPATQAVYSHFTDVLRWEDMEGDFSEAPYRPDDAALHHLFDGGWMWVLRLNNGLTSAGFSISDDLAAEVGAGEPSELWTRLLKRLPSVAEQFAEAKAARPFTRIPRLAFRTSACVGDRWAMLPGAAGFVDALYSTGFVLSLLGIERLAALVEGGFEASALEAYANDTFADIDATAELVAAAYRVMGDPEVFRAVTMLYFAAASFGETARRLGKVELTPGFLLRSHPVFGPTARECLAMAGHVPSEALMDRVARAVYPVNVAGVCDPAKRNWYPAAAADLYANADKLGATAEEITAMLHRAGFTG